MKFEFEDQKIDEVEKIDLRDFVISNKPTLVWASLNFPIYQNLEEKIYLQGKRMFQLI